MLDFFVKSLQALHDPFGLVLANNVIDFQICFFNFVAAMLVRIISISVQCTSIDILILPKLSSYLSNENFDLNFPSSQTFIQPKMVNFSGNLPWL